MLRYAVTIFLSAFLLFQVQPLISKVILPWFGGGPSVWTTCLVFFQVVLLGGYAYAHVVGTRLAQRRQAALHVVILAAAASVALLHLRPSESWKLTPGQDPALRILCLLAATVGLPYFVLSTTGPLLQAWFSRTNPGKSPYRLYALSNVGSLLALLSFPFVVEPWLPSSTQIVVWSVAFAVFAVSCGYCALQTWNVTLPPEGSVPPGKGAGADPAPEKPRCPPVYGRRPGGKKGAAKANEARIPGLWDYLFWLGLPACASVLLLAMTNRICQDVAVVPFLWILPLSLYLLSFIICFDNEKWYFRPVFWPAFMLSLAGIVALMFMGVSASLPLQVLGLSGGMFVCCMVCHGELVRLKPPPRYLTSFYLMVSAGGAIGGIFVGLIAPLVFRMHIEIHLGLWACLAMVLEAIWYQEKPHERWGEPWLVWSSLGICLVALLGFGWALHREVRYSLRGAISVSRNFYGVLTVYEWTRPEPDSLYYCLYNGRIKHGAQFLSADGRLKPTSYYGPQSGVGLAINRLRPDGSPMRVGVIGLGTGTIAAHGSPGDHYTFYDINPQVKKISEARYVPATKDEPAHRVGGLFTYLKDLEARGGTYEIVMGDARLSLERQVKEKHPQNLDVLAVDAFTSDAIPVHLLTREAFRLYWEHLKPDGVLAIHTSNRYLDLCPVVSALAALPPPATAPFAMLVPAGAVWPLAAPPPLASVPFAVIVPAGLVWAFAAIPAPEPPYKTALIASDDQDDELIDAAEWVLVTRNRRFLDDREVLTNLKIVLNPPPPQLWTDDYSNLFLSVREVIRLRQ